ncbi:hypothetical protein COO60DRAFT_1623953 [Scenedesmus sp. NREL 46B-D3]|nr:hypothetical protein COO60DRAFT_1623953 [Scenedesmus sp. NREL 46B-D3]
MTATRSTGWLSLHASTTAHMALHPECNLLPETIGKAALKAEDALRVLQMFIIASCLRADAAAAHGRLQQQRRLQGRMQRPQWRWQPGCRFWQQSVAALVDAADVQCSARSMAAAGKVATAARESKGNFFFKLGKQLVNPHKKIFKDGSAASPTLLVGLNRKVELYPGCCSAAKTEVQLSEKAQVVTCVAYDPTTLNVWTGCVDGSVLLHARGRWGFASLPTEVGLPVRAMAVDSRHFCWAGDDAGIIRVLSLDLNTDRLGVRFRVIPPQAHALVRLAAAQGPAAAAAAAAAPAASGPPGGAGKCVPVRAMLGKGPAVFASGSIGACSITVFNSQNYQELEVANCESFGATCCFAVLPWEADDAEQQAAAALAGQGASFAGGAVPGIPATGIAMGYAAAPVPRATVPASVMAHAAARAGGMAGQLPAGQLAGSAAGSSWRLLTGHERGQVLLWQFKGVQRSPASPRVMHLLCVIGEAKPQCAVRGMAVFEDLQMLVLAQSTGGLTALPMPAPHNGAAAAATRAPSFAAIKAHKNGIEVASSLRGLQVDARGTVVVQPKADPMQRYSSSAGGGVVPYSNAGHLPFIQAMGVPGPGQRASMQYPPPLLPPGAAPGSLGPSQSLAVSGCSSANNSGLEASNSVQPGEGIKLHHVICNSELVLKEVIGSGAEGKVYRGTWTNIDIAAKEYLAVDDCEAAAGKIPSELAMQRARDALRREVALLTSLNHPNLVRFCGVCLDPPLVVMEYYRHGNVYSMLEKARRQWGNVSVKTQHSRQATKYMNYFNWDRRLEMLHDVAAGMMYLHKRHYVHGDLRSPNLFVGLDGRVKIGDFGFTKRLSGNKASMQVKRITHPRWLAPEMITQNRLSTASDVYSYAIIMHEMLTWQMPFHDLSKEQVVLRVISGGRPELLNEEELPPGTSSSTYSDLPLPLPGGLAAAGGPLTPGLPRQLSARALAQVSAAEGPPAAPAHDDLKYDAGPFGVPQAAGPPADRAHDDLIYDAGPFGVPQAAAGRPAPAAVAVAAAATQPGASVVTVPGGGCVVVGSDVAAGSPPSSFTLSTRNSTEAGMSTTTAGLSTPPVSGPGGAWEGQIVKAAQQQQQQAPQREPAAVPSTRSSVAAAGARSAALPAYLDADHLDDSCLQPLDDEGPGLGAAITLVYQEGLTPAEAAKQSSYSIKSSNSSSCTLPSLNGGVASGSAGHRGGSARAGLPPAAGGYPASRPDSFVVDAGPFAAMNMTADLCDSGAAANAAGGAVPASMGDSPFAAAGGIAAAGSVAAPTAAAGRDAAPGQFGAGGGFVNSPFAAAAAAGAGMGGGAGGVPGWGPTAAAAGARQPSPGLPTGSPRRRSLSGFAGQMQQMPAGAGGADMAVGWLQTIGLAAAGRQQQHEAAGQVWPDYMTGGQAPAVPDAADGRRASCSSRASSYTATTGGPASTQSSMVGGAGAAGAPPRGVAAPAGAAGAAAAAGQAPESVASGPHYSQPLDDHILNKPLGTAKEEEDLVTKAERDLRAWESRTSDKSGKLRRTSAASGSQPGSSNSSDPSGTALAGVLAAQQQHQQQAMQPDGVLPSPFAAAAGSSQVHPPGAAAGATPAGWPPAGLLPGGGSGASAVLAAPAGPAGYPAAGPMAGPYNISRSPSSFDQVAPGERVTVVNRPFNVTAGSMDAAGLPSATPGSSVPVMQMQGGWGGTVPALSGRAISGPPTMLYSASPGGVPASSATGMQQHPMAFQGQQLQGSAVSGRAASGPPTMLYAAAPGSVPASSAAVMQHYPMGLQGQQLQGMPKHMQPGMQQLLVYIDGGFQLCLPGEGPGMCLYTNTQLHQYTKAGCLISTVRGSGDRRAVIETI